MKKKIITCAGVSLVIILVLLSVNFLQSGTGNISKENIEKENEFKDRLREKYSFKDYYVEGFCIDINKYIKTGEIEERESYFLFGYDGDIIEIDNLVNIKENK